jgi:Papain-like cysteine protease AvrRpt2
MYTVKNWQTIGLAQDDSTTCWLTCYKILYRWRGINAEGLDTILENAGIKMFDSESNGAKETGLKAKDYVKANSTLGLQSLKGGEFDQTELEYTLEKKGPIWATMKFGAKNHNIVIVGAGEEQVRYINPWWDVEKKYDMVTCQLSQLNPFLKHMNNWKGANACFPGVIE